MAVQTVVCLSEFCRPGDRSGRSATVSSSLASSPGRFVRSRKPEWVASGAPWRGGRWRRLLNIITIGVKEEIQPVGGARRAPSAADASGSRERAKSGRVFGIGLKQERAGQDRCSRNELQAAGRSRNLRLCKVIGKVDDCAGSCSLVVADRIRSLYARVLSRSDLGIPMGLGASLPYNATLTYKASLHALCGKPGLTEHRPRANRLRGDMWRYVFLTPERVAWAKGPRQRIPKSDTTQASLEREQRLS